MKRIYLSLVAAVCTFSSMPAKADNDYVSEYALTVASDKAYRISSNGDTQQVVQYSFPALAELKRLTLSTETFSDVQANAQGLVVQTVTSDSEPEPADTAKLPSFFAPDGEYWVYEDTVTYQSYDTDLNLVSTLEVERPYYYYIYSGDSAPTFDVKSDSGSAEVADTKCQDIIDASHALKKALKKPNGKKPKCGQAPNQ